MLVMIELSQLPAFQANQESVRSVDDRPLSRRYQSRLLGGIETLSSTHGLSEGRASHANLSPFFLSSGTTRISATLASPQIV